jgi:hypothetical protein
MIKTSIGNHANLRLDDLVLAKPLILRKYSHTFNDKNFRLEHLVNIPENFRLFNYVGRLVTLDGYFSTEWVDNAREGAGSFSDSSLSSGPKTRSN